MRQSAYRDQERRWIALGEDGRFVTLCRATDPTEEEIAQVEAAMRAQGRTGWLAVMECNPWITARPALLEVRPLGEPASNFADAVATFRAQRSV